MGISAHRLTLPGTAHVFTLSCYSRKNAVHMFKQSHGNLGANFISSDVERGHLQVEGAYAQSGPPAANGTDSAAEQQIEAEAAIPEEFILDE